LSDCDRRPPDGSAAGRQNEGFDHRGTVTLDMKMVDQEIAETPQEEVGP
jgi:hypothetical protein